MPVVLKLFAGQGPRRMDKALTLGSIKNPAFCMIMTLFTFRFL